MDKTSREYAEKLAEKYAEGKSSYPVFRENHSLDFKNGYLTAIEETNAKGKDDAIKELIGDVETILKKLPLGLTELTLQLKEAIRKAKEVTNGK